MGKLELTFPIFYHSAIKGACSLQQYNCVNVLLNGELKSDSGMSISESTASVYVNGTKPLPKDMIFGILHLSTEEIVRRLQELNFFDVTAIADFVTRLLDIVNISATAKKALLDMRLGEDSEYLFLCEVFRSALKNPTPIKRLTVEEKALIHACRSNSLGDDGQRPSPDDAAHSSDGIKAQTTPPQVEAAPSDSESSPVHQPLQYEKDRRELLRVCKYTAETSAQRRDLMDFCMERFVIREAFIDVDHEDITAVLPHSDDEYAVSLEYRGAMDEIKRYIMRSSHFSKAVSMLIYVVGPESVGLNDVSELTSVIQDKCADEANIIFGVEFDGSIAEGDLCVYLIATLHQKQKEPEKKTEDPGPSEPTRKFEAPFDFDIFGRFREGAEEPEEDISDERDQFPLNLFKD